MRRFSVRPSRHRFPPRTCHPCPHAPVWYAADRCSPPSMTFVPVLSHTAHPHFPVTARYSAQYEQSREGFSLNVLEIPSRPARLAIFARNYYAAVAILRAGNFHMKVGARHWERLTARSANAARSSTFRPNIAKPGTSTLPPALSSTEAQSVPRQRRMRGQCSK